VTRKISLGPNEATLVFELEREGKIIFTLADAERIIGSSRATARDVIYRLSRKGRVARVEKGRYVLAPARAGIEGNWAENPLVIIPHIIDEYYVGFWTAMNHWNMTEQLPVAIFVATTKRKRPVKYGGQPIKFITLSKRKFFGYTDERIDRQTFRISTPEKTIADALVFPRYCGGMSEVTKAMWNSRKRLDWSKVVAVTERIGIDVALRRLGYILRLLRIQRQISNSLARRGWSGFGFLEPSAPKKAIAYSRDFGLILNVSDQKLTSWRGA
jgi:predicted transcriptional regulator of viral defense system